MRSDSPTTQVSTKQGAHTMKALASIRQSQLVVPRLRAVLLPIALLLPLWTVGIFGRSYWKPDEPREAAIVWRMHQSGNTAVPSLAGTPFLEKPPLLYWAAQPFMSEGRAGLGALACRISSTRVLQRCACFYLRRNS